MKTLVALAALAAIVAAVLYFDRDRPTTDEIRHSTEQLFVALDPTRIDHLTIDRQGGRVELTRRGGWWLGDHTRADDSAVEPILSTLAFGQVERRVEPGARAQSGVETPRVHLVATGKDLTLDLRIGADAAGRGVFVARGADLLVAEHRLLEVTVADFRSRAPVLEDPTAVTTVQIGALGLERHGVGWRILEPKPALADAERVGALLNALVNARADSLQSGPLPSPSAGEDTLLLDSRLQGRIRWQGCGKLPQVVRSDGALLCFSAESLQPLRVTVDELREPHLSNLRLDDLDAVDLELAGKALSLRHAQHAWRITAPAADAAAADEASVRDRLSEILKLRARAFAQPGAPFGRLRLAGAGEDVDITLGRAGYEVTAQRKGEDLALLLPASTLKLFDADAMTLRSHRVDTFRRDQVSALSADGKDLPRDPSLEEALSDLHAESQQRRNFTVAHTLKVSAAGVTHSFAIGPSDADGCLVRAGDSGPAFVIAPATCSVLLRPFAKK